jgi:hypothetical protein
MAYFADFSACSYHRGPFDAGSWRCPLLAIGWLEYPNEFPKGGRLAEDVRDRLAFLRFAFSQAHSSHVFRGWHDCSWCRADGVKATLHDSHINILVPDVNRVFIAPGRIDHYVERHGYLLPKEFLGALMQCPDPRDSNYETMLASANGGVGSPLADESDGGGFA